MRRFGFVLFPLLLLLLAVACSGDDNAGTSTPAATASGAATSSPAGSGAASSCAAAAKQGTIKIGEVGSLSGGQSSDADVKPVYEMAIDDVNANGILVGDTCYKLDNQGTIDDAGDPGKLTAGFTSMVEDKKVQFLVGPFISPVQDLTSITTPNKVICLSARNCGISLANSAADIQACVLAACKYTLTSFSLYNVIPAIVQHALSLPPFNTATKIAALATNACSLYTDQMKRVVEGEGKQFTVQLYDPAASTDFSAVLTTLKASKPDLLFYACGTNDQMSLVLKTAIDLNVAPMFYSWTGDVTWPQTYGSGGGPITEPWVAVQFPRALGDGDPALDKYTAGFAQRVGISADEAKKTNRGASGIVIYDAIRCLAQAMEKAKSIDPDVIIQTATSADFQCQGSLSIIGWSSFYHDMGTVYEDATVINGQLKYSKYIIPVPTQPGDPTLIDPKKQIWQPAQ